MAIDAAAGLVARVKGDATLISLMGADEVGEARFEEGWPGDELDGSSLPRSTVLVVTDTPIRGVTRSRAQIDIWCPEDDDDRVLIDARFLELLHEKRWTHGGVRYYAVAQAARDYPGPPGGVVRRKRDYLLTAQSLS